MGLGGLDLLFFFPLSMRLPNEGQAPVGELVDRSADQQNAVVMVSSLLADPISIERAKSLDHSLAQNSDGGFDPVPCACL